ncbi:hypothetical protein TNCV_972621 [Trichonephila clavipes]|nr:hypothetical protein TNCV_972621 [Trichonephila clavipes]
MPIPPDRQRSDRSPPNSSWQMAKGPVVIRNFEHHVDDSTIWLVSTSIFKRTHCGGSKASRLSIYSTNHTRVLAALHLFRELPRRKGTAHLQTSISSTGFKSRPYGTAISVTNNYTKWAVCLIVFNIQKI